MPAAKAGQPPRKRLASPPSPTAARDGQAGCRELPEGRPTRLPAVAAASRWATGSLVAPRDVRTRDERSEVGRSDGGLQSGRPNTYNLVSR